MQRKQSLKSSNHGQLGELLPDISENPNDLHSSKIEVSSSSSSNSQSQMSQGTVKSSRNDHNNDQVQTERNQEQEIKLPQIKPSSHSKGSKVDFHPDCQSFAELGGTDDQTENQTAGNETLDILYMEQFSINRKTRNFVSQSQTDPDCSKSGPPKEFDIQHK